MKKTAIFVGAAAALTLSACSQAPEEEPLEPAETMVADEGATAEFDDAAEPAVDERTTEEGDSGDPVPDDRTGVDDRITD
uniref:hypothetical protein n=1 Tax=uncultured Erythrobacter sp. TaxID=263913 RepID=UPI0026082618|nr:hypothetical protein [uncultured Erythrobacter sp.]